MVMMLQTKLLLPHPPLLPASWIPVFYSWTKTLPRPLVCQPRASRTARRWSRAGPTCKPSDTVWRSTKVGQVFNSTRRAKFNYGNTAMIGRGNRCTGRQDVSPFQRRKAEVRRTLLHTTLNRHEMQSNLRVASADITRAHLMTYQRDFHAIEDASMP
jgi:hypothetical protein